ncbi:hypothetical protein S40288_10304 [Stachybotrys chartarum IBT 40288]|nr:hypothetical protein S40288_10304 [Stachybotrys chartarum IBT 40288]
MEIDSNIDHASGEIFSNEPSTKRGLKSRHAQLIALGGTIGTGLFVGSGRTLAKGGPGFTLISYIIMSVLVFMIVTSITTTAAYLPVKGTTPATLMRQYVSPSLGFAMAWFYWYAFGIFVAYDITAASLIIEFWNPPISPAVWITVMIVVVVALNLMPVPSCSSGGGGPGNPMLAFHYWNNPGAFNEYILEGPAGLAVSFWSTLISALLPFSFAPEMLVFCSGEMRSPRRNIPRAAKSFIIRILVLYLGSIIAIGSSPFVLGIRRAGIRALDRVINAAILLSAWSASNAFVFQSSRSLYSMSINGDAPKVLSKCNKHGVPWVAVLATSCFSLLSYMNVNTTSGQVFNWLVNLVNTAAFISWIGCPVASIRFQKAFKLQGCNKDDLTYSSRLQPLASYIFIVVFCLLCLINGFEVFLPNSWSVSAFLSSYIGIPIFLVLYFGHRLTARRSDPWWMPLETLDLQTGLDQLKADEQVFTRKISAWKRLCRNFHPCFGQEISKKTEVLSINIDTMGAP